MTGMRLGLHVRPTRLLCRNSWKMIRRCQYRNYFSACEIPRWWANRARFRALQRQGKLTRDGITQAEKDLKERKRVQDEMIKVVNVRNPRTMTFILAEKIRVMGYLRVSGLIHLLKVCLLMCT